VAIRLFLAVWITVVTTAAVTNASGDKPPCTVSAHAHPGYTVDKAGRRHYACASVSRPK
jgi:hypothetical protein